MVRVRWLRADLENNITTNACCTCGKKWGEYSCFLRSHFRGIILYCFRNGRWYVVLHSTRGSLHGLLKKTADAVSVIAPPGILKLFIITQEIRFHEKVVAVHVLAHTRPKSSPKFGSVLLFPWQRDRWMLRAKFDFAPKSHGSLAGRSGVLCVRASWCLQQFMSVSSSILSPCVLAYPIWPNVHFE